PRSVPACRWPMPSWPQPSWPQPSWPMASWPGPSPRRAWPGHLSATRPSSSPGSLLVLLAGPAVVVLALTPATLRAATAEPSIAVPAAPVTFAARPALRSAALGPRPPTLRRVPPLADRLQADLPLRVDLLDLHG